MEVRVLILAVTLNMAVDKTYTVPDYSIGNVFRTEEYKALPGGKGVNVVRVAKALGEDVRLTGFIGGNNGKTVLEGLKDQGIKSDFEFVKEETRTCINVLDSKNNTSTEILEAGPYIYEDELDRFLERYKYLSKRANVVALSGSLPNGVPKGIYENLINIAKENKAVTILDSSKESLEKGLRAIPFMAKPNRKELENVLGISLKCENDIINAADKYMKKGIKLFVVSMGEDGSIVGYNGDLYKVIPPQITPVNPVGCGDALVAGFAIGLSRNMDIKEVIRLSTAAATSNVLNYGAGIIKIEEVNSFLERINIIKI